MGEVTTSHTSHPPARYNKHTRTAQYAVHKSNAMTFGKVDFSNVQISYVAVAASLCVILLPISIFWCHYYYLIISSCRWWKASINLPSSKGPLHIHCPYRTAGPAELFSAWWWLLFFCFYLLMTLHMHREWHRKRRPTKWGKMNLKLATKIW